VLEEQLRTNKYFEIAADKGPRNEYNAKLDMIKETIRRGSSAPSFHTNLLFFFALRIACVVAAFFVPIGWVLALAALQFVLLPHSLFVSLAELWVLGLALFVGHFCVAMPLQLASSLLIPTALNLSLPISNTFIICFFVVDQLLCSLCVWRTPACATNPVTRTRLAQSVIFGFLNCKTYFLLLLLPLRGLAIPLIPWAIDAYFELSIRVTRWSARKFLHWAALFYIQHSLAHLPNVYGDAHKFHHYLHDTTAFDAHIYGSGAPEEYFCLLGELLPALLFGTAPPSLSGCVLWISWTNKIAHSRKSVAEDGCNFHADHHLYHTKNFGGYYPPLDMYMGTAAITGENRCPGYRVLTEERPDDILFKFTPLTAKA
jgi:sterol desaturase/sphingolipid hydroxylase (fatty acid hydroxylase superfamily)